MKENDRGFNERLKEYAGEAEEIVRAYLPLISEYPGSLDESMRYSVQAGGKRLRPVMLGYTCRAYGGSIADAKPFMAAIEYIHTSSLIHDDLPAIDNDDLRRGQQTVHKAFGEAVGILAGDALLNYAYEVMIKGIRSCSHTQCGALAADILASKSGLYGMLGGQGLDVESEKGRITFENIEFLDRIYTMKTSALIEASLMAGAALAMAPKRELALLEEIGRDVGMAFQIKDDILDLTGTPESLGKPVHSDEKNQKATCISLLGEEKAQERVRALSERAVQNAKKLDCDTSFLEGLIVYLTERKF